MLEYNMSGKEYVWLILCVILCSRLPVEKHKVAVEVAYQIFSAEDRYSKEIRRSALERVCIPLLRSVKQDALIDFFLAHVKHLVDTIQIKLKVWCEACSQRVAVI